MKNTLKHAMWYLCDWSGVIASSERQNCSVICRVVNQQLSLCVYCTNLETRLLPKNFTHPMIQYRISIKRGTSAYLAKQSDRALNQILECIDNEKR